MQSLAATIVIAVFLITFAVQAFQIPSESMEKTLLIGDYLLVDKAHYAKPGLFSWLLPYRPIKRQEIIVFRYPVNPQQHFVKRVIGIPGDHIRLVNKHVYVNGVKQPDEYATFNWAVHDRFRDEFPNGGFFTDRIASKWFMQAQKTHGRRPAHRPGRLAISFSETIETTAMIRAIGAWFPPKTSLDVP